MLVVDPQLLYTGHDCNFIPVYETESVQNEKLEGEDPVVVEQFFPAEIV